MEMQEMEIIIDKTGNVQVAVKGVKGDGCLALSKNLEGALGSVTGREYTGEYYEQPETVSSTQQQDLR
ncbi:MAG: DUF2997 domain-containing protein [Methanomicrobiales archaeon]|nr:DUF2997 domain-containing protein [Methanomicrobiales archaeon]